MPIFESVFSRPLPIALTTLRCACSIASPVADACGERSSIRYGLIADAP